MGENITMKDDKSPTTDGEAIVIQPSSIGFTIEELLSYPSNTEPSYYEDPGKQIDYAHPCPTYEIETVPSSPADFMVTGYPDTNQNVLLASYNDIYYHEAATNQNDSDISTRKRSWDSAFDSEVRAAAEPNVVMEESQGSQDTMFEIVVKAIMSAKGGEVLLGDIYNYIVENYAKFRCAEKDSWRVTVRHALSVNTCFIKGRKAKNGRGFYWKIHPACLEMFSQNDLDRKRAAKLVQQATSASNKRSTSSKTEHMHEDRCQYSSSVAQHPRHNDPLQDKLMVEEHNSSVRHYVPMTTIPLTSYTYYELLVNLCDLREQH